MSLISRKTGNFVPCIQYLLPPFDSDFLNGKTKVLTDKQVPEFQVSLKFAKKHVDTAELRDKVVQESLDELTIYLASLSHSISFPELTIPLGVHLRRFKKNTSNAAYRKIVSSFLDNLKLTEDLVIQKRKAVANIWKDAFEVGETKLEVEAKKIEKRREEMIASRIAAAQKD